MTEDFRQAALPAMSRYLLFIDTNRYRFPADKLIINLRKVLIYEASQGRLPCLPEVRIGLSECRPYPLSGCNPVLIIQPQESGNCRGNLVLVQLAFLADFPQLGCTRADTSHTYLCSAYTIASVTPPGVDRFRSPAVIRGDYKGSFVPVCRMFLNEVPKIGNELIRLSG